MVMPTNAERTEPTERIGRVAESAAPPLVPNQQPIDLSQLSRMTLGEQGLEREVLALFDLQAGILLSRMANEERQVVAGLAHTLTGSARGVGAWRVAEASEAVERLASVDAPAMLNGAVGRLTTTVAEAQAMIAAILADR
jgi:HPt (histidine-containing phosphotransfer) domain-containing protein